MTGRERVLCESKDISGRHACEREKDHKGPHCKFGTVSVMAWGGEWTKIVPLNAPTWRMGSSSD